MASCKDCMHCLVCDYWEKEAYPNDCENYDKALCKFFKNEADFVEVETVKAWLWAIAHNNVGNHLGEACKDLTTRLDGLRMFAKERRELT